MAQKLTKANLLKFADDIYHETKTKITYTPLHAGGLCHTKGGTILYNGDLCQTNSDVVHCAIGEMYVRFIGPIATKKNGKWSVKRLITSQAIHKLCDAAGKINPNLFINPTLYHELSVELNNVVDSNDEVAGDTEDSMIRRAHGVKKRLVKIANIFLK